MTIKACYTLMFFALWGGLGRQAFAQEATSVSPRLLEALRSPNALSRARAFTQLSDKQRATSRVRAALLDLLVRENRVVDSLNAAGTGSSIALGEGYTEYLSEVIRECFLHCNRSDPRVIRALTTTMYSEESELAEMLAKDHGSTATSIMLERAQSPVPVIRQIALQNLGTFYAKGNGLTAEQRSRIHNLARVSTGDTSVGMRISALRVLGKIGNREDLSLLRQVSRSDMISAVGANGKRFYPVRDASDSAIARIERHPPN